MTNEELTVLKDLITDDLISRKSAECFAAKGREDKNRCDLLTKERERLMAEIKRLKETELDECNRLRESEANALNAAEEAKRERDEARKKFGEWILFVESQVFVRLRAAKTKKNLLREVEETIASMVKFQDEHQTTIIEGRMAK